VTSCWSMPPPPGGRGTSARFSREGVEIAATSIDSGCAQRKLDELQRFAHDAAPAGGAGLNTTYGRTTRTWLLGWPATTTRRVDSPRGAEAGTRALI